MIVREQLISIGTFNKPHGVNGEISATLLIENAFLSHFRCLVCNVEGIFVPFFITNFRAKNSTTALLTIDGIASDDEATILVNKEIFVLKAEYELLSMTEDADELPLDYFIGFKVSNNGDEVGQIIGIDDSTDNVLFIVDSGENHIVRIPAVSDFILSIDQDGKIVIMDLPEGLLTL